jgi:guanyl-specific ribonuclease Sa
MASNMVADFSGRTIDDVATGNWEDLSYQGGSVTVMVLTAKAGGKLMPKGASPKVPTRAMDVLAEIDRTGRAPAGYRGGRIFRDDGQVLPQVDSAGNPITYREWDVNPNAPGVPRDAERIVTGSDGSMWYTDDHYSTFRRGR